MEGVNGLQYGATSISNNIKKAVIRTGRKKGAYLHTLCHSFTALPLKEENDCGLQEWVGNASSRTTERYIYGSETTFSRFKNQIDDMEL